MGRSFRFTQFVKHTTYFYNVEREKANSSKEQANACAVQHLD